MLIPQIGSKGVFNFAPPFDTKINMALEYTVVSITSLVALYNDGVKPFETIYKVVGLTETDYNNDIKDSVPVIGFNTSGCQTFYIPANKIKTVPQIIGIQYVGKALVINLGNVPMDMDFTMLKSLLTDTVYDATGIKPTIAEALTAAPFVVSEADDTRYRALLANGKKVDKSFKTRYEETLVLLDKKDTLLKNLETCMKKKCTPTT